MIVDRSSNAAYPVPMAPERRDDQRLEAWRALLQAQRVLLDRLEEELRGEHGLPLSWYDVLVQLSRAHGRRMRMNELASNVLITPSGLTRLVDRLEREGLVCRERCSFDRRGSEVVLTPEGQAVLRQAAPTHLRGIEQHFARHLTDEEAETLRDALGKILRALRAQGETSGEGPESPAEARERAVEGY